MLACRKSPSNDSSSLSHCAHVMKSEDYKATETRGPFNTLPSASSNGEDFSQRSLDAGLARLINAPRPSSARMLLNDNATKLFDYIYEVVKGTGQAAT
jgi:hypothetical protein